MRWQLCHLHSIALGPNPFITFAKMNIFWGVLFVRSQCIFSLFKDTENEYRFHCKKMTACFDFSVCFKIKKEIVIITYTRSISQSEFLNKILFSNLPWVTLFIVLCFAWHDSLQSSCIIQSLHRGSDCSCQLGFFKINVKVMFVCHQIYVLHFLQKCKETQFQKQPCEDGCSEKEWLDQNYQVSFYQWR